MTEEPIPDPMTQQQWEAETLKAEIAFKWREEYYEWLDQQERENDTL